eukprot:1188964-Prorocentrum_minimum.AAC.3
MEDAEAIKKRDCGWGPIETAPRRSARRSNTTRSADFILRTPFPDFHKGAMGTKGTDTPIKWSRAYRRSPKTKQASSLPPCQGTPGSSQAWMGTPPVLYPSAECNPILSRDNAVFWDAKRKHRGLSRYGGVQIRGQHTSYNLAWRTML